MNALSRAVGVCSLALVVALASVAAGHAQRALGQDQAETVGAAETTATSRERALAEQEVFGFLPHWEMGDADGIDLDALTTLAWFGVEAGADGRLVRSTDEGGATPGWAGWTGEAFAALKERAQAAGVRVVLTVERFSWDQAGKRTTTALLKDPEARAALVRDIVASVTVRGADGVNLDFEPLPTAVRREFTDLVRELRAGLDAVDPTLQLTFDLPPSVTGYWLKPLTALDAADGVVLMGYEYRSAGSRVAGSVAPLRDRDGLDLRASVKRVLKRVPADRVILALPWYGRAWSTKDAKSPSKTRRSDRFIGPSVASYEISVGRAGASGRMYDRTQASAWSVYPAAACETCPISWRQLWYDDVDAFRAKTRFAVRKSLRGVGIWALGHQGDRPELWSALRLGLHGSQDHQPPIGSVSLMPQSVIGMREGLPVVGHSVSLATEAGDGTDGSGVAFVRVASRGRLDDGGSLRYGTTFPAGDSVRVSMPSAEPVQDVFVPAGETPPAVPIPDSDPGPVTLRIQWRDVAGNWSAPERLRVYFDPGEA